VLPLESVESFTLIVLNGIARLLVTIRFLTTGGACAAVLEATGGVADAVADTLASRVAVTAGAPCDPQALIISRLLTANVILAADLIVSSR
jgi:ketopantoate hydroxymethyltransferase